MKNVVVVGGGPAGLMAAEVLASAGKGNGLGVALYDGMPSVGRKFLLAGKGGLNLTHSEPLARFVTRFATGGGAQASAMQTGRRMAFHTFFFVFGAICRS